MIKTHKIGALVGLDGFVEWEVHHPGAEVQLFNRSRKAGEGYGIVIAVVGDEMTVLWSQVPRGIRSFPPMKGENITWINGRMQLYDDGDQRKWNMKVKTW